MANAKRFALPIGIVAFLLALLLQHPSPAQQAPRSWVDQPSGQYTLIARDSANNNSNIRPILVDANGHLIVNTAASSATTLTFGRIANVTTIAAPEAIDVATTVYRSVCIQFFDADADAVGTAFIGTAGGQTFEVPAAPNSMCLENTRLDTIFYRVTDNNDGVEVITQVVP